MRTLLSFLLTFLALPAFAAFPTTASRTESNRASATTSHSVTLDNADNSGDLLIIFFSCFSATCDPVTPSGYTEKFTDDNAVVEASIWAKSASGSEGSSVSVTTGPSVSSASHVLRITGWDGSVADDVECSLSFNQTTSTATGNGVTASWGSDDNKFLAWVFTGDDDATVSTYPTNYGNGVDVVSGAGTNAGNTVGTAERDLTASSNTPDNFILSESERTMAGTCVVKPAAATSSAALLFYEVDE